MFQTIIIYNTFLNPEYHVHKLAILLNYLQIFKLPVWKQITLASSLLRLNKVKLTAKQFWGGQVKWLVVKFTCCHCPPILRHVINGSSQDSSFNCMRERHKQTKNCCHIRGMGSEGGKTGTTIATRQQIRPSSFIDLLARVCSWVKSQICISSPNEDISIYHHTWMLLSANTDR